MPQLDGSPDSTPVAQPQPVEVQPTQPTPSAQDQARQDIYNQYASLYGQQPQPPQAPPAPAPAPATPEPVPPTDYQALIDAQKAELNAIKAELEALKPKPPAPAAPAKDEMEQWVELLANGKYAEAKQFLLQVMAPVLQQQIQPQLVQQSVEAANAEQEINRFISTFETENADLLHVKDYVALGAERRLKIAQDEGKIKSTADFVREYKAAVTNEANELRQKFQIARSAGREEALTTRREVLSATTLEPNGVRPPNVNAQPVTNDPMSYIQQRREQLAKVQGLRN